MGWKMSFLLFKRFSSILYWFETSNHIHLFCMDDTFIDALCIDDKGNMYCTLILKNIGCILDAYHCTLWQHITALWWIPIYCVVCTLGHAFLLNMYYLSLTSNRLIHTTINDRISHFTKCSFMNNSQWHFLYHREWKLRTEPPSSWNGIKPA